jgi:hypothetical protein
MLKHAFYVLYTFTLINEIFEIIKQKGYYEYLFELYIH